MANFYKNQGFKLGTTNLTTVLTTNTSSVVIVKGMNLINEHSSVLVECFLHDSSAGTDFEFFRADIPTNTTQFNAAGQAINLEAGDAIKAKSETANKIEGVISFLQIDRSQENG